MDSQRGSQLFEEFFKSALDIHIINNPEGVVEYTNPKWTEVLGWGPEALLGHGLIEFVHPDDVQRTMVYCTAVKNSTELMVCDNRFRTKTGSYRWIKWQSRCRDGYIYISGHDITELKIKEIFLKDIEHSAHIIGWRLNVSSGEFFWSSNETSISGFKAPKSLTELENLPFASPAHAKELKSAIARIVEGDSNFELDVALNLSHATATWLRFRAFSIRELGKVIALSGTIQEVTEMRNISREVFNQKAKLERLMQNSPGMVYQFRLGVDGSATMDYASPKAFDIYEVTAEEFKANPAALHETVHPDDADSIMASTIESLKTMTPFEWTGRLLTRSGKVKWINARSIPEQQEDGSTLWDGIVIDVTREVEREKEVAEQALVSQHQSRLASVGLLAAGVGHEINNPLAVILGKIWTIEKELTKPDVDIKSILTALEKQKIAVSRIQKIVDGLRTFTRMDKVEENSCWANEVTSQVLMMMEEIFSKEKLQIDFEPLTEDVRLRCGAGQFQQVLMNLISNARDATQDQFHREVRIRLNKRDSGRIEVIVSDNGCGMKDEIADRIFEPFYTTKDVGRGTGLGLGISKSLAQAWGGDLTLLASRPGMGSTFRFWVPTKAKEQSDLISGGRMTAYVEPSFRLARKLRILVIEDNYEIQAMIRDLCMECGADVAVAKSGRDAIALIPQLGPLDLVITDLNIAKEDGEKLIEEVLSLYGNRPRPRIFGLSSRPADRLSESGRLADGLFMKPFDPESLVDLLKEVAKSRSGDKIESLSR